MLAAERENSLAQRRASEAALQAGYGQDEDHDTAIALYDYTGRDHAHALSFFAGERIFLTECPPEVLATGWMSGRLANGSEGLFPASYVQLN